MTTGIQRLSPIIENRHAIHEYLATYHKTDVPFYSSVDVRISADKAAVVDANLFPAGFNNIHPEDWSGVINALCAQVADVSPSVRNVLLIPEEHTRNLWYLENIWVLSSLLGQAGYQVTIATFLDNDPEYCKSTNFLNLTTATGKSIDLHCIHRIVQEIKSGVREYDLAVLNNDLSEGMPDILRMLNCPVVPSPLAGWHRRHKSGHFTCVESIAIDLGKQFDFDPWLITCKYGTVAGVDIMRDGDRDRLADAISVLLNDIRDKYREHKIEETPLVFLKSDSGTYGMGVLPVDNLVLSSILAHISVCAATEELTALRTGHLPVST
ncbi:hypothetical protein EBR96_01150 [bacterium]|nr:hypothetical protein [bacterium]